MTGYCALVVYSFQNVMIVIDQAITPGVHWEKSAPVLALRNQRGDTYCDKDKVILRDHHIRR